MDDTFTARFQNASFEDDARMVVVDVARGIRLMATERFYGHEIDRQGEPLIKGLTAKLSLYGYVPAPGCGWTFEGGHSWSVPVVRRKNERYRLSLGCGCYDWRTFPPIGVTAPCLDHGSAQLIFSYLDTMNERLHAT